MIRLTITIATLVFLLAGCDEKPVPSNKFEAAVYSDSRPSKDVEQDTRRSPVAILELAQLKSGDKAADILAGSGYYAELMSHLVGEKGRVYLHNAPQKAEKIAAKLEQRLENNRLPNVSAVTSPFAQLQLPEPVDFVLLSKVFHDLFVSREGKDVNAEVNDFFQHLQQNLTNGAKVLVIDHSAPVGSGIETTTKTHRIDEDYVKSIFAQNGFKLIGSSDALRVPGDDRTLNIWKSEVRSNTDRFALLFQKQ